MRYDWSLNFLPSATAQSVGTVEYTDHIFAEGKTIQRMS